MKTKKLVLLILIITMANILSAKEYHVAKTGHDSNDGSLLKPFKSISKAVEHAFPNDTITVHKGVYREWVNPLRGGNSDKERILYRAAEGEKVEIKGSEIVSGWKQIKKGVWKVVLPNTFFKGYNPYKDLINGDWFKNEGRIHHTGEVFLNGISLYEKENLDSVLNVKNSRGKPEKEYTWYCETNEQNTTIWANFKDFNPNKELTEISVRRTCFYPSEPGINFITIRGFEISQAATQWAAPTAEQVGMIATHWNKGWIIENNIIHDSKCSGITLGKERGTGHNVWSADKSIDGAVHYLEVTFKAIRNGWNKENIGSHIVRNNEIYNCEQAGICGSFGAAFSTIENNHIHHIWTKKQFRGPERAGIKFHGGVDVIIQKNRINDCALGVFLDWMAQGSRISQNLLYDNVEMDMYFEVNHGPFLVDNNILLSNTGLVVQSNGGAFVHNLFVGKTIIWAEPFRYTPYQLPHSTDIAGISKISTADNRYYNNIFIGIGEGKGSNEVDINLYGLSSLDDSLQVAWGSLEKRKIKEPSYVNGNVYFNGAMPYKNEKNYVLAGKHNPEISLKKENGSMCLNIEQSKKILNYKAKIITTEVLGRAKLSKAAFENRDGSLLTIDIDYSGNTRKHDKLMAGPFSELIVGNNIIEVW